MNAQRPLRLFSKIGFLIVLLSLLFVNLGAYDSVRAQAEPLYSVIATIPVGEQPNGIAVNEITNRIYVTNYTDNTVSVIDGDTNLVIATVPVGEGPSGIGVNPVTNKIYVANHNSASPVSMIDGQTNAVIANIPVSNNAFGIGINPNTNQIYVTVQQDTAHYIEIIDGATESVISTIPCGVAPDPVRLTFASYCSPSHVVVDPSTGKIYVHDFNAGVVVLDETNVVVSAITGVGGGSNDYALGINKNTRRLYSGSNIRLGLPISVVNLDTQETVATIPLPDGSLTGGIAINEDLNHVYIASRGFFILDGATNTFLDHQVSTFDARGIAVNQITDRVYVANSGDNTVLVIKNTSSSPTPTFTPSSTPTFTPSPTPTNTPSPNEVIEYFALGDSIASGHGLMDDGSECYRSFNDAYPWKVYGLLNERYGTVHFPPSQFLACSGAEAGLDLNKTQIDRHKWLGYQVDDVLTKIEQIPDDRPVLVSISIGMNDLGWTEPGILAQFKKDRVNFTKWINGEAASVAVSLRVEIQRLLAHPNVVVVINEYHNPFNELSHIFTIAQRNKLTSCVDLWGDLECYERTELAVHTLNQTLVLDVMVPINRLFSDRVLVARTHLAFHGHQSPSPGCGFADPNNAQTWVQYPGDPESNSTVWRLLQPVVGLKTGDCFHPNKKGAQAYADAVLNAGVILLENQLSNP